MTILFEGNFRVCLSIESKAIDPILSDNLIKIQKVYEANLGESVPQQQSQMKRVNDVDENNRTKRAKLNDKESDTQTTKCSELKVKSLAKCLDCYLNGLKSDACRFIGWRKWVVFPFANKTKKMGNWHGNPRHWNLIEINHFEVQKKVLLHCIPVHPVYNQSTTQLSLIILLCQVFYFFFKSYLWSKYIQSTRYASLVFDTILSINSNRAVIAVINMYWDPCITCFFVFVQVLQHAVYNHR